MNTLFSNIGSCIRIVFHFEKKHSLLLLLSLMLVSVISPLRLFVIGRFIDAAVIVIDTRKSYAGVVFWCGLLALCLITSAALTFYSKSQEIKIKERLYGDFSKGILNKIMGIDYSYFEKPETYDTIQRMGEDPQEKLLNTFITVVSLVAGIAAVAAYTVIFVRISILFALLGFLVLAAIIFFNNSAMGMMNKLYEEQTFDERMQDYYGKILSDKHSLYELRIYNAVEYIISKRIAIAGRITADRRKRTVKSQLVVGYASLSIVLWLAVIIVYLTASIIKGNISIGVFISLLGSVGSILNCFDGLSKDFSELLRTSRRIKYYNLLMEYPARPVSGTSLMNVLKDPVIRFEHVSFTYPGTTKKILDDISFEIPYGSKTALVGENGAGKSTIIKLICGLYTPVAGVITVNGINAADIPMQDRSKLYSVAFQDYGTYMFPLRENIALGDTARINNDEELNDALRTCFAPELAGKLDRPIGRFDDNSMDLSTGQWQKIALARAQFRPYSVIILDEPTASLDPIAENDLYTSFMQVINRGSCVLVSHRLAMVRLTDQIIVLDKGRIKETGRHDDLMSRRGLYASMFQAQRQWYEEGGIHDEPEA